MAAAAGAAPVAIGKMGKFENRQKFQHNGQTVYEWEQSMEEVLLYVTPPPGVKARDIECKIKVNHLSLGIKGNPPFLDHDTGGAVVMDESMWTLGTVPRRFAASPLRRLLCFPPLHCRHATATPPQRRHPLTARPRVSRSPPSRPCHAAANSPLW